MKLRIILKAYSNQLLDEGCEHIYSTLSSYKISGIVSLPTRVKRFCVLRSPHIDKDSREHFEIRVFKRFLDITSDSPEIFDSLLQMDLPSGIACSLKILDSRPYQI